MQIAKSLPLSKYAKTLLSKEFCTYLYCSCSFEPEIIKIGQSSHKMYSNSILNFQESMTILNACTKKVWKIIEGTTYEEY